MSESVENVKAVAVFLREHAAKIEGETANKRLLSDHAGTVEAAAAEILRLRDLTSALPADLGSIHDLPQELLDELSVAKTDDLEDQLVTVINAYGGEASLDQILVGLYRKFKVSQKRRFLQNKLYRMTVVWGVDGKKGIYTTKEPPLSVSEGIQRMAINISGPRGKKDPPQDDHDYDVDIVHKDDDNSDIPF